MPGPIAFIILRKRRFAPAEVRTTVFTLMIGTYSGVLLLSAAFSGILRNITDGLITNLPSTIAGLLVGVYVFHRIPVLWLDVITTVLMVATVLMLAVKIGGINFSFSLTN